MQLRAIFPISLFRRTAEFVKIPLTKWAAGFHFPRGRQKSSYATVCITDLSQWEPQIQQIRHYYNKIRRIKEATYNKKYSKHLRKTHELPRSESCNYSEFTVTLSIHKTHSLASAFGSKPTDPHFPAPRPNDPPFFTFLKIAQPKSENVFYYSANLKILFPFSCGIQWLPNTNSPSVFFYFFAGKVGPTTY